jgi:hypothetical protein
MVRPFRFVNEGRSLTDSLLSPSGATLSVRTRMTTTGQLTLNCKDPLDGKAA